MGYSINIDVKDATSKLNRLGKQLSKSVVNTALSRTINRTLTTGRTQASRDIRSNYRIKKSDLDRKLKVYKASKVNLHGRINAYGVPISLNYFRPLQRKLGTSVNVSGKRRMIKHAFIAAMPPRDVTGRLQGPGRKAVFMRSKKGYNGSGIEYTPGGRLPITKLVTLSEGAMFANPDVIEKTEAKIQSTFNSRFDHELNYLLRNAI